ncbi:MAG: 4Fe-4S binding protein [Spirochaetia bacterium]|nr:4Fe-4S binding protein [Spirochaetia bacterium]MCF7953507.1 4Fe-4S binding protein [Spirochaetales bacterium]
MAKIRSKTKISRLRLAVQIFFFLIVTLVILAHALEDMGITIPLFSGASLHAICPFGGVVTLYNLISDGTYIQKIHESAVLLMIFVGISAVLAGPFFCGWLCPFGSFQEWLGKIGKRIFKKRYNHFIPQKIDYVLRYLRYAVLVWVLIMTVITAKLVFQDYDPYYALFNFWSGEVAVTGYIALGLVIVLTLFVERPFCKYACPYGAVLGLFNFFRIFKLRRNDKTCIHCKLCDKACPMNIEVSSKTTVRDHQCISCYACTSEVSCPIENTAAFKSTKYKTTLSETSSAAAGKLRNKGEA